MRIVSQTDSSPATLVDPQRKSGFRCSPVPFGLMNLVTSVLPRVIPSLPFEVVTAFQFSPFGSSTVLFFAVDPPPAAFWKHLVSRIAVILGSEAVVV